MDNYQNKKSILSMLVNRSPPGREHLDFLLNNKKIDFNFFNKSFMFYIHSGRLNFIPRLVNIYHQIFPIDHKIPSKRSKYTEWETFIPFYFHPRKIEKIFKNLDSKKFEYPIIIRSLLENNLKSLYIKSHQP